MDILKNPFHILGATTRDDRYRIMELAEERSLLSDLDECMEARSILTIPRRRISAEVTWLPGINQILINGFLNLLEQSAELRMELYNKLIAFMENVNETGYEQSLFGNEKLTPLSRANLLAAGLSRVHDYLLDDIVQLRGYVYPPQTTVEWILAIAKVSEDIESETVGAILNGDRRASGFPEITDLSAIDDEIRNQKRYYSQTVTSVLENLSVNARARTMTSLLKTATGNGRYRCPTMIKDLILTYEHSVRASLDQNKKIIEAQDEKLRAMADAKNPDTTLSAIVDQLLESVKVWDTLAQPIQLSQKSTGQRHDASFEMARRFRQLAADLFLKYNKPDFSRRILNTLKDVFSEVPEIVEQIDEDLIELEKQASLVKSVEKFEEINTQVEKLKNASDAKQSDYILSSMVTQLIQTVKTWSIAIQPVEANEAVELVVRGIALHLWNEHQKSDFSKKILITLKSVFAEVPDIAGKITKDLTDLEEQTRLVESMEKFEEIKSQVEKLKNASDAKQPDYTLTPMVNQLIQTVKTWNPSTQQVEANNAVAITVRNTALHLWNEHQKLDFATQITNALIGVFKGVYGMNEVNNRLNEDIITLYTMDVRRKQVIEEQQQRGGTGCLLQIAIFAILALIGALSQGC